MEVEEPIRVSPPPMSPAMSPRCLSPVLLDVGSRERPRPPRGLNLIISGLTVIIIGQEETTTSDPSTATHFAFFGGKRFSYVRYPPTIAPPLVI
jgi:hypothetical protein